MPPLTDVDPTIRRAAKGTCRSWRSRGRRRAKRAELAVNLWHASSGHSIDLTLASMKAITSGSSPYLAYNCWSISGSGFDQSMFEDAVKSGRGTYFQVLAGLCCVILSTPSIVLANLDLTYCRHACASASVSNEPMVMNVCVTATSGSSTVGLFNATPKKSVVDP